MTENGSVTFFCNATSYPPHASLSPHITWNKLGDKNKLFPPGEQLVLQNVGRHNGGTYVCKAENGLGFPDTADAVLSVLRKYIHAINKKKKKKKQKEISLTVSKKKHRGVWNESGK